jgi:peptide/nickel transport system ATP-binding protein
MEGITGSPPDLRDLPKGCAFNPRCRWAMQQCREERPRLLPLDGSSREVACWLHRGGAVVPPELARPEPPAKKLEHAAVIGVGQL